jgi:DNA helicase-2/ATP-dependent DNA helicase PcrA
MSHPAIAERLRRLAPDQRAAATATPGPVLCVAPAGSGKTTTLVARIAWLIDQGASPNSICAITFNKRAADELRERVGAALAPLGEDVADRVRIRTFHALGLEMLRDAGRRTAPLVDRDEILRVIRPHATPAELRQLDTLMSRFKLDLDIDPMAIEADPEAGPVARTYAAYEAEIGRRGGIDFDDLVARALRLLATDDAALARWRARCEHLLVDEAQDLDRAQLRMALVLAAPANRIFLVGDDDQSIYGWRLADVRRLLGLASESLPNLTRVDLETNYRCPAPVLARAVRLVENNVERFAKVIRPGPEAGGRLILAASGADDADRAAAVLESWPDDGGTRAILARTNRELFPVIVACLRRRVPFRAAELRLPIESPLVDELLAEAEGAGYASSERPLLALARVRSRESKVGAPGDVTPTRTAGDDATSDHSAGDLDQRPSILAALLGWAASCPDLGGLRARIAATRALLTELRSDQALLLLATAHGTKGLEFDHVAVVGLDEGRFPSARSIREALEPERALEEERRLAYVAWTRARRSLTLVYDPGAPSPFLHEAFTRDELGALRVRASAIIHAVSRIPSLGPRGEGWVALQFVMLWLVVAGTVAGSTFVIADPRIGQAVRAAGLALLAIGALVIVWGVVALRKAGSFTVLPHPSAGGRLAESGPYRFVRHPIYAGLIAAAFGAALKELSVLGIVAAIGLFIVLDLKRRREEAWLCERFPAYDAYRTRTRALVPFVY